MSQKNPFGSSAILEDEQEDYTGGTSTPETVISLAATVFALYRVCVCVCTYVRMYVFVWIYNVHTYISYVYIYKWMYNDGCCFCFFVRNSLAALLCSYIYIHTKIVGGRGARWRYKGELKPCTQREGCGRGGRRHFWDDSQSLQDPNSYLQICAGQEAVRERYTDVCRASKRWKEIFPFVNWDTTSAYRVSKRSRFSICVVTYTAH